MRKTLWLSETQTNACQSFTRVMTVTTVGAPARAQTDTSLLILQSN